MCNAEIMIISTIVYSLPLANMIGSIIYIGVSVFLTSFKVQNQPTKVFVMTIWKKLKPIYDYCILK